MEKFPTSVDISNLKIESVTPTLYAEGGDFTPWVQASGHHRYQISFKVEVDDLTQRKLDAFYSRLRGRANPFQLYLPSRCNTKGTLAGNVTVKTAIQPGARELQYNSVGLFEEGDYFTIGNDPKVYMVDTHSPQTKTITFSPDLRKSAPAGTIITYNGVVFTCIMSSDTITVTSTTGHVYSSTINVLEI